MRVVIYRLPDATLSLERSDDAGPIEAWLSDEYRIASGIGGPDKMYVFGASGESMTVDKAVEAGVLEIPLTKQRIR